MSALERLLAVREQQRPQGQGPGLLRRPTLGAPALRRDFLRLQGLMAELAAIIATGALPPAREVPRDGQAGQARGQRA